MIQRKCGTCRFFEEGGIAASGWCRHPDRQDLQHMVLVRKTELACRDGWDRDLWAPREEGSQGDVTPSIGAAAETFSSRSSRSHESHANGTGAAGTERGQSRSGATGVAEPRQPGIALQESEQTKPDQRPSPTSENRFSEQRGIDAWSSSSFPSREDQVPQSDEVGDESISTRDLRQDAPWRQQLEQLRQQGTQSFETISSPVLFDRPSAAPEGAHARQTEDRPDYGHFGAANASSDEHRNQPEERGRFGTRSVYDYEHESHGPVEQSGETEPFEVPDAPDHFEVEELDPDLEIGGSSDEISDPDSREVVDLGLSDLGEAPLPLGVRTQQCCRTCRDFLPTDGGKRGWCSNTHAFETRQQVDADVVSCRGTFGSWWAPADDWWLERADISHHSTPTPLVQQLIRETRERQVQGSTPGIKRS